MFGSRFLPLRRRRHVQTEAFGFGCIFKQTEKESGKKHFTRCLEMQINVHFKPQTITVHYEYLVMNRNKKPRLTGKR